MLLVAVVCKVLRGLLPLPQVRHIKEATNAFDKDHKLHTYSIGIKGALRPPLLPGRKR